jgi:dihydrofolate reductase
MAKLIYSMLTSLDGYTEDEHGRFGWGAPEDEEVHSYINQLVSSFGTYLYGRRMYDTMVYWETAHTVRDQPRFVLDSAKQWQAAEKIVYSRTLAEPRAIRAGLVDEFLMIVCPSVVGSGKRFFPDGVRLDLELVEERRFRKGVIVLRYAVCG